MGVIVYSVSSFLSQVDMLQSLYTIQFYRKQLTFYLIWNTLKVYCAVYTRMIYSRQNKKRNARITEFSFRKKTVVYRLHSYFGNRNLQQKDSMSVANFFSSLCEWPPPPLKRRLVHCYASGIIHKVREMN